MVECDADGRISSDEKGIAPLLAIKKPKAERTKFRIGTHPGKLVQIPKGDIVFVDRRSNFSGQRHAFSTRRTPEANT